MFSTKICFIVIISILFTWVASDMLEDERVSYFGFTHEILISSSTLEVAEELEVTVWKHARGDRRVRRYFDSYDAPFVGGRRSIDKDDDIMLEGDVKELTASNSF